eukprot:7540670-Prorocentrum_lima.AAC.1
MAARPPLPCMTSAGSVTERKRYGVAALAKQQAAVQEPVRPAQVKAPLTPQRSNVRSGDGPL